MLKIGVTGGIGSGKSTVCRMFENLGIPSFTSDLWGRKILNTDKSVIRKVKQHFGDNVYAADGTLDRKRLATVVFSDPEDLQRLSDIVHPKVQQAFEDWVVKQGKVPYVIKEAAILLESGAHKDLDRVITVFAAKEERIKRVMERDQASREEVAKRMRNQYTDEERNSLADFIIINEKNEPLLPQVMELHELFINEGR